MTSRASRCVSISVAVLLALWCAPAFAHDPPHGTGVFWQGQQLLIRTNRGLLTSSDGVSDFGLLCNEALGISIFEIPGIVARGDGSWLIGTSHGLLVASADLCSLEALAPLDTVPIAALVADPRDATRIYATTAATTQPNGLYVSEDSGVSFASYGEATAGIEYDQLRVSLAQPSRFYASGRQAQAAGARPSYFFAQSSDVGLSFTRFDFTLLENEYAAELYDEQPTRAGMLFGVAHAYSGTRFQDRFIVSTDSGESWSDALSSTTIDAFTLDARAGQLWVGSVAGLWRSADLGSSFTQLQERPVYCLTRNADRLYVCDGMGASGGLSVSKDAGATLTRVMRFGQVQQPLACPADATVSRMCSAAWGDWQRELSAEPPLMLDAAVAEADAAIVDAAPAADAGRFDAAVAEVDAAIADAAPAADAGRVDAGKKTTRRVSTSSAAGGGCSCQVIGRDPQPCGPGLWFATGCLVFVLLRAGRRPRRLRTLCHP